MRSYPAGWPDPEDPDQVEPTLYLFMEGATWPAAHDNLPAGCLVVGMYSIARNLRGSLLPGAIRRASGFSVGTADADVAQPTDKLLAPWLSGTEKVVPAGTAQLIASYDGPTGATAFSLGTFQVDPVSGRLSDPSLAVSLVESLVRMRQRESMPPYLGTSEFGGDEPVDAAWVIDLIARSCRFYTTPPAPADAFLSVPLQGGFANEPFTAGPFANTFFPDGVVETGGISGWEPGLGAIVPTAPFKLFYLTDETKQPVFNVQTYYMALSFTGTVTFAPTFPEFELRPGGVFAITNGLGGWVTQTYTPGLNADWPDRVEVEISYTTGPNTTRARVRSDPSAAWSSYAVGPSGAVNANQASIVCTAGSTLNGFYMYTVPGAPWPAPNASIYLLDRELLAVDFDGAIDALTAIQQVTAGALGGQWFGGDGSLVIRPRGWLLGDTAIVDTVKVKTKFADVIWSIDPNDVADRVELTYTPPAVEISTAVPGQIIWSADKVHSVAAHGTLSFIVNPDESAYSGGYGSPAQLGVDTLVAADSNGTPVPGGGGITYIVEQLAFGRVRITLISAYSQTVYFVDSSGSPFLKLYAPYVARFTTPVTISKGVEDFEAVTPLTVNLGRWCQTEREANEALDTIYAGTRTPNWRILSVDVLPDMRRELGDIVRLQFADVDLNVKAIITGLNQSNRGQQASFTILEPIVRDFDEAWDAAMPGVTVADFDTFWDTRMPGATAADFDIDPLATP